MFKESIRYGWDEIKNNLQYFVVLMIIVWAVSLLPQAIGVFLGRESATLNIIAFIVQIIMQMGVINITLLLYKKKIPSYKELFTSYPMFWKFLLATVLYMLIVFAGLILFIIPGMILGIKFRFYEYFVIEKKMGPIEALKASSKITQGQKWELFKFFLVLVLINILGLLAFVVGLLVTVPLSLMAVVHVYKKLS